MSDELNGNAIRVTNHRGQRAYLTYILRLLQGSPDKNGVQHPKHDSVSITAMGNAIPNAVNIAEIVKRRVPGLHQITSISSDEITYEDKNNASNQAKTRKVSTISIQLSCEQLNTQDIGYQPPIDESLVTNEEPPRTRAPAQKYDAASGRGGRGARNTNRRERGGSWQPRGAANATNSTSDGRDYYQLDSNVRRAAENSRNGRARGGWRGSRGY